MKIFPSFARLFLPVLLIGLAAQANAQTFSLTNIVRTGTNITLSWTDAGSNFAYTVQSRSSLGESVWLLPSEIQPWPVAATQWIGPWFPSNTMRFYRVLVVPVAERGKVLSQTLAATYSTFLIQFFLNSQGIPVTAQYNVQVFKITYETINPWGGQTIASGVLAVPTATGISWPLFSYQHGTITRTNEAPSAMDLESEFAISVLAATSGYAAVLPDYLGLGDSPGFHPYHHARSQATASVDLLRAARAVCASNSVPLNGQLFLCGYSQGGHATMALHRELEALHTNEFTVTASAPMAGAYDLSGTTTDDFLSARPKPQPYYFANLLAAYQDVYQLAPSFADLLDAPYNTTLPPLLNGNTDGSQINAAMPADPIDILKPEYLAAFIANSDHPLRQTLRENDVLNWTPQAPMRLYHCSGDMDVLPLNSQVAYNHFLNRGATNVQLIVPSGADHSGCAQPSLLQAKEWFDSLKE